MKPEKFKWGLLVLLTIFIVSTLFIFSPRPDIGSAYIDPAVLSAISENIILGRVIGDAETKVPVVVKLKDAAAGDFEEKKANIKRSQEDVLADLGQDDISIKRRYETVNVVSVDITTKGLEQLKQNPNIESIILDQELHILLDESVPQITANQVWQKTVFNQTITGLGQTVCTIDTGIEATHPAFKDKIKSQYCYCSLTNTDGQPCCPDNTNEDSLATDDNGHGTHIAGTAAGNLTGFKGVAPDAGIVAIKVCSQSGACLTSDIIAGIDRCVSNASVYNISVISISLGGGGPYDSYCNNDAIASSINSAVGRNISVVVSSGNNGFTTGISTPSCVQNATPVGAVNTADTISYNRGTILELLAPGISINAAYLGGGTTSLSGTSMSAPHVAGGILLLRQYWNLAYDAIPTPEEIEMKLKLTGKNIVDTASSQNYSRIDLLAAISPHLNFIDLTPLNAAILKSTSVSINISSDVSLSNSQLEWTFPNGTKQNYSMSSSNSKNFSRQMTDLTTGNHSYKVFSNDSANTLASTAARTLSIELSPDIHFTTPINTTLYGPIFYLNILINNTNLANSSYNITNSTNNILQSNFTVINGSNFTWSDLVNLSNYPSDNYSLTVTAIGTNAQFSTQRAIVQLDKTAPVITFYNPANNSYQAQALNLNVTLYDLQLSTSYYNLTNSSGSVQSMTSSNLSTTFTWLDLVNLSNSTFSDGNYTLNIQVDDSVGNEQKSSILFTLDKTPPLLLSDTTFNTVYNNDTLQFRVNVTDDNLNNSHIMLEILHTTWKNYSLNFYSGNQYNVTLSGNLTPLSNVSYRFVAIDKAGNRNATNYLSFIVRNHAPSNVNITPANNSLQELGKSILFTSTATDSDVLNYSWNFNPGTAKVQNPTHIFNQTGTILVTLNVSDGYNNSIKHLTIRVNDTNPPELTSVSYDAVRHLEDDGSTLSVKVTALDYSGISDLNLTFNNVTPAPTCTKTNSTWICSYTLTGLTQGTHNFSINVSDNFATKHGTFSTYKLTVNSCEDTKKNGDETGVDCGGKCSACPASGSSSSSGSSGGGSGSAGGSSSSSGDSSGSSNSASESQEIAIAAEQDEQEEESNEAADSRNSENTEESEESTSIITTAAVSDLTLESDVANSLTGGAIFDGFKRATLSKTGFWTILGIALIIAGFFVYRFSQKSEEISFEQK
jgi:subtilisin family serine protease